MLTFLIDKVRQPTTTPPDGAQKVRFLSPFRYPGGKSWFVDIVRRWLKAHQPYSNSLIEPFAGGAGVSLFAVSEGLVKNAKFAELDREVSAAWQTILNGHSDWLADRVETFQLTRKTLEWEMNQKPTKNSELAFQCILRNRTARGGVMAAGAGLIREGDGDGIRSRWYPKTIANRIRTIATFRKRLKFSQENGFDLIRRFSADSGAAFFIDPPYTVAARRLYRHWNVDHQELFQLISEVVGPVLMTYDDASEVRAWAREFGFKVKQISMKTTHHTRKQELMISRNFDWL